MIRRSKIRLSHYGLIFITGIPMPQKGDYIFKWALITKARPIETVKTTSMKKFIIQFSRIITGSNIRQHHTLMSKVGNHNVHIKLTTGTKWIMSDATLYGVVPLSCQFSPKSSQQTPHSLPVSLTSDLFSATVTAVCNAVCDIMISYMNRHEYRRE